MIEKPTLEKRQFSMINVPNPLITFFITAIALIAFFALTDTAPFGKDAFLLSDLQAQYAPKLVGYKNHFLAEGTLSYSFINGMGKNIWGVFAYYLSSPFNFITFLFPAQWIAQSVVFMIIAKLSLAGAFMSWYLEYRSGRKDRGSILFALSYVFSTYAVIFMMNIMWLDGFLLLPLLLVVIEKYMTDRSKWIVLTITLTFLFISGYYIAYMVGIFSFLYLLGRCVECDAFSLERLKNTRKTILIFIGSALLATGLCAWFLLPAGIDTLGHPDYTNIEFSHTTTFEPINILEQFFIGTFDNLANNKPLLYAGMLTFVFVVLFFLHPQISKRRKMVSGIALLFFFFSFIYTGLVRFWHLFDEPNWFYHRQSFIVVFIIVSIAYNAYIRRAKLEKKHIIISGLIVSALLVFFSSFGDVKIKGERFFVNLIFLIIILALLLCLITKSWPASLMRLKKYAFPLLAIIVVIEIALVNSLWVRTEAKFHLGIIQDQFEVEYNAMQTLRNDVEEHRDNPNNNFYRMEVDRRTTMMNNWTAGHYLNYPSTSVFQSVSNKNVNRFLKQLGMRTNYNYFSSVHSYNAAPPDTFLGIEYLMTTLNQSAGYPVVQSIGEDPSYYLHQNISALPLMFPVHADAKDFDFYRMERNETDKNYFTFQNEWWASMLCPSEDIEIYYPAHIEGPYLNNAIIAESEELFHKMHLTYIDDLGLEAREGPRDIETRYLCVNSNANMVLDYEIHVLSYDPLYFSLPVWDANPYVSLYIDSELIWLSSPAFFTEIIELGTFEPGDILNLRIESASESEVIGIIDAYAYHCDIEMFGDLIMKSDIHSAVRYIDVKNGHVQSTLVLEEDSLVITTIPLEKGWTLLVDGEEKVISSYQDAFVSFYLEEGVHDIELVFRAPGLRAGVAISVVSLVVLLTLVFIRYVYRGKNDRQAKKNT